MARYEIAVIPGDGVGREVMPAALTVLDSLSRGFSIDIGQIWSASMMLDHLGEAEAAAATMKAIERVLSDPEAPRTPDLGGSASTSDLAAAIAAAV